jgi:hypothetical protein
MKESVIGFILLIILGTGMVTVIIIQSVEAGPISTSRSNIKAMRQSQTTGGDGQMINQDVGITNTISADNNCGSASECSLAISNNGDIKNNARMAPPDRP